MNYIIGMDVCGTTSRMKIADADGKSIGEYNDVGISFNVANYQILASSYRNIIMNALNELRLSPSDCISLCIGASGIDSQEIRNKYNQIFCELGFNKDILNIYNDCELLVHVGQNEACIAVVAGSGSIIVGKDKDERVVRYGGWGYLASDEGGGFYLAQQAVRKVIHYMDGFGSCKILTKYIIDFTEAQTPLDLENYMEENISAKRTIEKIAKLVIKSAEEGDKTAIAIIQSAVIHLYHGVNTVIHKIRKSDDEKAIIFLSGSILSNNKFVSDMFIKQLSANLKNFETGFLQNAAVDIALHIAKNKI